jgi:hypothetical protein
VNSVLVSWSVRHYNAAKQVPACNNRQSFWISTFNENKATKYTILSDNGSFHWSTREAICCLSSSVRIHPDSGMLP